MKLYTLTFSTLYTTNFLLHICILYFELYSFCALNAYITCTILYNCAIKTHLVLVDVKDGMCTRKTGHNNIEGKRKGVTKKNLFFQSSGQATVAGIAKMLKEPNIMEKLHMELVRTGTHWVYGPELCDQPSRNVRKST